MMSGTRVAVLEVGVLAPEAVVAEVPAVVAPQHDDGVLAQAEPVEFRRARGRPARRCNWWRRSSRGSARAPSRPESRPASGYRCRSAARPNRAARTFGAPLGGKGLSASCELRVAVEVVVPLGRDEGQVRLEEADGEEERLVLERRAAPRWRRRRSCRRRVRCRRRPALPTEGRSWPARSLRRPCAAACPSTIPASFSSRSVLLESAAFSGVFHRGAFGFPGGDAPDSRVVQPAVVDLAEARW